MFLQSFFHRLDDGEIDFDKWFNSPYYPTPTIIAAAVERR